jgi:hypothetical protein
VHGSKSAGTETRHHGGKIWTHAENLRLFETALGEDLQFLTVCKTAFDKLMPLKWSFLLRLSMSHHAHVLKLHIVNISVAMLCHLTYPLIMVSPAL